MKALAGRRSFRPGTNFAGWMYRIERNEFLSELRRSRPRVDIDAVDQLVLSVPPRQDNGVVMREFMAAFRQLPVGARQALLLGHLNDYSQEQIARHSGIGVGAVKSRISRGRAMLARLLAPTINIPSGRSCPLNSTESCLPS
jgi:RNA polymerase sigma-70 factor (ECF subfamily)